MNDGFEEIMAQASPPVQKLARRTKALIEAASGYLPNLKKS